MRRHFLSLLLLSMLFAVHGRATAQIPAPETSSGRAYRADGTTDVPFTVEVVDARRTVSNTLLLRLALTNRGTSPMAVKTDFAGNGNPAENGKISALYAVDPNGRKKYTVLRNEAGETICSKVDPALKPGERRELSAQLAAPPDTTSAFDLYFPKAQAILTVPIGLPQAGEALTPGASIGNPGGVPVPANPVPPAPSSAIDAPTSNNQPDVYVNQTNLIAPGTSRKGIGSVESSNSAVPFTVEVTSLKSPANGPATLTLAFTNGGSGNLDASGLFNAGAADLGDPRQISGVYLVDPATRQRFEVVRESQTKASCSKIEPAFGPGERRALEAQFPAIPASVKSVYVYFPHAAPITDVPVAR